MSEVIYPDAKKLEKINKNRYHMDFDPHGAVVVGTGSGEKLVPRANLRRWGGESFLEVLYDRLWTQKTVVEEKEATDITGLQLDSDDGKEAIRCNAIAGREGAEKGGFEYDIVLYEKPTDETVNTGLDETPILLKSNEFVFRYRDSGNLRFLYQEPYSTCELSPEDVSAGVVTRDDTGGWDKDGRKIVNVPDWAHKSWAVYQTDHNILYKNSTEAAKYQGGKFCHIHRPKAIDDNGNWVWCDIDINTVTEQMKVTIPSSFLETAAYPVRVDPTFGYTTLGSTDYSSNDVIIGRASVGPGENGSVSSIHVGIGSDWGSGEFWKCALYTDASPCVLQSPQSEAKSDGHGTAQFVQFDVSGGVTVSDQNYIVATWWQAVTNIRRDSGGSSGDSKFYETPYGTWPASFTSSNSSNYYSTYATYTATPVFSHSVHGVGGDLSKSTFTTPGTDTYNVPAGVAQVIAKIWGAGGGGAGGGIGPTGDGDGGPGWAGGFVQATLTVTPESTLNLSIGGGGDFGEGATTQSGAGGGGGGMTGIFDGVISTRGNALLIAGAGGGGGGGDNSAATQGGDGGGGGGTTGDSGGASGSSVGGSGGTQSAGGAGGDCTGTCTDGEAGETDGTYEGGDGAYHSASGRGATGGVGGTQYGGAGEDEDTNGFAGGGGGGSGYYGGGGGSSSVSGNAGAGGGGGGSSYISGTSTTNTQATGQEPPNTSDGDYVDGYGAGGNGGAQGGNDGIAGEGGLIVITPVGPSIGTVHGVAKANIGSVHGVVGT
jgi:hypothetical protein